MKTVDGRLIVVSGASRSGKTAWVKKRVARSRRIWAWDPEAQWCELPGWIKVTDKAKLIEMSRKPGPQKVAFVPGGELKKEFDFWAGVTFYTGRCFGAVDVIGEELADVTTPSKAPGNWGILLRRGLKRGINIYAISQRWAEADKTAIGNASEYVCFSMGGDDIDYMAKKTRIPVQELEALKELEFIIIDRLNKNISRGKLRF